MKKLNYIILFLAALLSTSCISQKDIQYLQPSESLVINEEGLIPYNIPEYRVTKNDIFSLNIVTTPKGDAAQFYSMYNTSGGNGGGSTLTGGGSVGASPAFYNLGIRVDSQGNLNVLGILEPIKAEGRTIEAIQQDIQTKVNENFLEGKTQVRLNLDGINYYILGDIETTDNTGPKKSYSNSLSVIEAIANNGGLNRTIDRKNVKLQRRYPEGIKTVMLDLTREDVQNSQYFWVQNGDIIYLNTRSKSLHGFGKDPIQTLTTGVSLLTTVMSIYLLITRL